jgi:hypothetical protein
LHRDRIAQPVSGLSIIEILPEGPALRALADVTHLPPWLRARAVGREAAAATAAVATGDAGETAA